MNECFIVILPRYLPLRHQEVAFFQSGECDDRTRVFVSYWEQPSPEELFKSKSFLPRFASTKNNFGGMKPRGVKNLHPFHCLRRVGARIAIMTEPHDLSEFKQRGPCPVTSSPYLRSGEQRVYTKK